MSLFSAYYLSLFLSRTHVNQDGKVHSNTFSITYQDGNGNPQSVDSNAIDTTVVEPNIDNVDKEANVVTADAGDAVTFTVTYTNSGNTTAFDVRLFDQPVTTELENIRSVIINSDAVLSNVNNVSTDTEVDVTLDSVAVGETITITYVADLVSDLVSGSSITNTANVTYTSLPKTGTPDTDILNNPTGSDADGASGDPNGERNGNDGAGDENTNLNNYADSDSDDITINSLSIGSTVFEDTNNNGVQDPTELGISNVVVHLYDQNNNPVLDASGTAVTTITDPDGNYIFDTLPTGSYQVVIPASNFTGGALASKTISADDTPNTSGDNGIDGDDNGVQPLGARTEVRSPIIELIAGTEPEDTDAINPEVGSGSTLDNAIDANPLTLALFLLVVLLEVSKQT